jgi:hypothetical protein
MTKTSTPAKSPRPQAYTVFGAAIVAGAAAAFGLNSALDTHLAQVRPQVESESILVALRALPTGAPVTVWDVGLRDWPKAMVPSSAMRVTDDLDNLVVRHPLREGQPILAVQLGRADATAEIAARPLTVAPPTPPSIREPEQDLWESTPTAPVATLLTSAAPRPTVTTVTTVSTTFAAEKTASPPTTSVTVSPTPAPPITANPTPAPAVETLTEVQPPAQGLPQLAEETLPLATVATAPAGEAIASTTPQSADGPQPEQGSVLIPEADATGTAMATAPTPFASPATTDPSSPVVESGVSPPAPIRTALRPRPSLIHAFSVPSRSALSDAVDGSLGEAPIPSNDSGRVTAQTVAGERAIAVNPSQRKDKAPRMLPADRDGSVASGSLSEPPLAPQARAAASRSTPPSPPTRAARSTGFSRGYRPN